MRTKPQGGQQLSLGVELSRPDVLRLLADLPIHEQVNILATMLLALVDPGPGKPSILPPEVLTKVKALITRAKKGDAATPPTSGAQFSGEFRGTLRQARERFEREYIVRCLREAHWNVTRAAERPGIERSNLHRKMKDYTIEKSTDSA